jgi:nicotinate-nucleotide adenylyltransferase
MLIEQSTISIQQSTMKIGLFGGTFDPPHIGHLILAAEARAQLGLDRLLWVLTPEPPHKCTQRITPLATRLELLRTALRDEPAFEISTVDIARPGPHYAIETVQILGERYPQAKLIYVMGGDSLRDLPTWRKPQEFLARLAGLGVMRRPGDAIDLDALERQLPGVSAKVRFIEAPLLTIAASDIRQRIAEGRPYRYYLPAAVYELIQQQHIYANPSTNSQRITE